MGTLGTAYSPRVSLEQSPALRPHVQRAEARVAKFVIGPDQSEGSMEVKEIQENHREGSGLRAIFFIVFYLNYNISFISSQPSHVLPASLPLCKFMEE